MLKPHVLLTAALILPLSLVACGRVSRAGDATTTSYYEQKDYSYDRRSDFEADMNRAIDKLEARLAELKAEAAQAGDKVRVETREVIDDIEAQLPELRQNLAEAKESTEAGWKEFKRSFQSAFDDLGRRLDRAFS